MDIANTLTELIKTGLTQDQIAKSIGCKQPTVSAMVTGKSGKSRPSWKIVQGIRKLAKEKGLPVESDDVISP